MNGAVSFLVSFDVDNDWDCASDTIMHLKNVVAQELHRLNAQDKLGPGISIDDVEEHWNDLEYKDEQARYEDYLMDTDPRV